MQWQGQPFSGMTRGFCECPFDMDSLLNRYAQGAKSPDKMIYFEGIDPQMSITVNKGTVQNSDGIRSIDLVACSCFFESSVQNFRTSNIHKGGSARASEFWGVIPTNIASPKLLQKLHQGGLKKIVVSRLAFLETGKPEDKPTVIQTEVYETCFLTHLDMTSYDILTLFSFSFVGVQITRRDYQIKHPNGQGGQFVYSFDYAKPSGSTSKI